ncbi:MAG: TlpA disulfide reductase family protein, partial [Planctomycetota bacterium]
LTVVLGLTLAVPAIAQLSDDAVRMTRDQHWGDDDDSWRTHNAMVGRKSPRFGASSWHVKTMRGKDIKDRILVIDFWATWCGPCIAAIPKNNEMAKKYADQGVVVMAAANSRSEPEMKRLIEQHDVAYPSAWVDRQTIEAWNVRWYPSYAVVDRDGIVRGMGLDPSALGPMVDALLEEQPWEPGSGRVARDTQPQPTPDVVLSAAPAPTDSASQAATPHVAEIDPAWLEGDADTRSRLAELEANAQRPPGLDVSNWLNSAPLRGDDLRGKVVVLDFWATWCGPCIRAIPKANELHETYADDGLVFVGICQPDGGDRMGDVVEKQGIRFPVALDHDGQTTKRYEVNGFPDYYLIDRAGNLRIADCRNGSVEDAVKALLAEPNPFEESDRRSAGR